MSEDNLVESNQQVPISIREINAIERNRNEMITSRDEIREYVEQPLVDACERFWDLNVRTLASSSNSKDVGYRAYIIIDHDSLSEENRTIADKEGEMLENYDGRPAIDINIPVTERTTPDDIRQRMSEIASKFKKQKATWIPSYSLQEMRKIYGIGSEDEKYGVDDFKEEGYYYDLEGKRFYLSEEHCRKAKEEVE